MPLQASLFFSIAGNQRFTLHCPTSYPDYQVSGCHVQSRITFFFQDDNFFVEADSSLHQWCNALNEFLLDSHCKLDLGAILSKGTSLYSSKDRTRRESEMEVGDEERASDDKDEGAVSEDDDDEVVENLERDDLDLESWAGIRESILQRLLMGGEAQLIHCLTGQCPRTFP